MRLQITDLLARAGDPDAFEFLTLDPDRHLYTVLDTRTWTVLTAGSLRRILADLRRVFNAHHYTRTQALVTKEASEMGYEVAWTEPISQPADPRARTVVYGIVHNRKRIIAIGTPSILRSALTDLRLREQRK
jgi:hypothetical protein